MRLAEIPYFGGHRPPLRSFADNRYENLSSVRCAAMLEQKNALPGTELHFPVDKRHSVARARQDHADMRRHVIAAFGAVCEIIGVFGNKAFKKLLQITARGWIGILHNDNAAACVLDKNDHCPVSHLARVDFLLHIIGNFVQSFSMCANLQLFVTYAHKIYATKLTSEDRVLKGGGLRQ
jgi:hypothetical protein